MNQQDLLHWIETGSAGIAEHVKQTGVMTVDEEELLALREGAGAKVAALAGPRFSEEIASDCQLAGNLRNCEAQLESYRRNLAACEARLTSTREQVGKLLAPSNIWGIGTAAVGVFTLCFAPTILSVFLAGMDDRVLAWAFSFWLGATVGSFLTMLLLPADGESASVKSSVKLGVALGLGFGLLRLSIADGLPDYLKAWA